MTERFYDPHDLNNSLEASMTETALASQCLLQVDRDNATTSLAARDLQPEDALILCAFQKSADVTTSESCIPSNLSTSAHAMYWECSETEITDVPSGELKGQDEAKVLATQLLDDTEERDTD